MTPQNRRIAAPQIPGDVAGDGEDVAWKGELRHPLPGEEPVTSIKAAAVFRAIAGAVLVVGLSTAVAWGARHHITTSPSFAVVDIVTSGNKHRSSEDLASIAGITKGMNVFCLDLEQSRARLLADPWISEATLARRLPGTVLVQVTEREAGALVALGGTYLASRDGEIFKRLEASDPTDLPVITGLTADEVASDREGVAGAIRRALDLALDYERGPLGQRAVLQEIHLKDDGAVTLVVGKDALFLEMGKPPFHRKLEEASRVLLELDHRAGRPDAVMLDNDARPERVVVRMR